MEQQFNINEIIERYKLDKEELAKVLFPAVKYPKQAFDRVLKSETNLDTEQLERLAGHIGVLVSDLFAVNTWKGTTENGCLTMIKGEYKVKLNYKGVYISVYKGEQLIHQKLSNVPGMVMSEFVDYLDNIINNYENGNLQN